MLRQRVARDTKRKSSLTEFQLPVIVHVAPTISLSAPNIPEDVRQTCKELSEMSWRVRLMTVGESSQPVNTGGPIEGFVNVFAGVPLLNKLHVSPALSRALKTTISSAELVHAHGLWLFSNAYATNAARKAGRPYIISTRGMLAPEALKHSVPQKWVFWQLHQKSALEGAACLHATSEQEYEDLRSLGLTAPIAIIPLGVTPAISAQPPRAKSDDRILLSLGRLHPIKGLDYLLASWARIEADHPNWRLWIAGPSDGGYEAELRRLASTLGTTRVEFLGPCVGAAKAEVFAAASLFALPSRSENFALTVPEAMSYGLPVIASKGTPWRALAERNCGWWVDIGVEPLATVLSHAMELSPQELSEMGERGRKWVSQDFTWQKVALRFQEVYRWTQGRATLPSDVRLD